MFTILVQFVLRTAKHFWPTDAFFSIKTKLWKIVRQMSRLHWKYLLQLTKNNGRNKLEWDIVTKMRILKKNMLTYALMQKKN